MEDATERGEGRRGRRGGERKGKEGKGGGWRGGKIRSNREVIVFGRRNGSLTFFSFTVTSFSISSSRFLFSSFLLFLHLFISSFLLSLLYLCHCIFFLLHFLLYHLPYSPLLSSLLPFYSSFSSSSLLPYLIFLPFPPSATTYPFSSLFSFSSSSFSSVSSSFFFPSSLPSASLLYHLILCLSLSFSSPFVTSLPALLAPRLLLSPPISSVPHIFSWFL